MTGFKNRHPAWELRIDQPSLKGLHQLKPVNSSIAQICESWKEKSMCTCTFVCVLLFYSSSVLCLHFFLSVLVCDLKYSVCFLFFSKVSLCLKESMFISTHCHPSSSYAGICALIVFCVKVLFGGISRCTTGSFVSEADALTLPLSSSRWRTKTHVPCVLSWHTMSMMLWLGTVLHSKHLWCLVEFTQKDKWLHLFFSPEIRISPTKPCGKGSKGKQNDLDEDDDDDYEEEEEQ